MEHLKLPHYVTFGSSLQGTLAMQAERNATLTPTLSQREMEPDPSPSGRGGGEGTPDDHNGIPAGQLHHHGDGVLHAHDD